MSLYFIDLSGELCSGILSEMGILLDLDGR